MSRQRKRVKKLSDEEVSDLFYEAIENFPPEHQEAARNWLAEREAAWEVIRDLETKGLDALTRDDATGG